MSGATRQTGRRWAGVVLAVLGASACSPTFNWRELRPQGTPLEALMPCKPESATRPVPLLGTPVPLHMHSCDAGGLTFAVAWAELAEASQAQEALQQWQSASLAAIRVQPGGAGRDENWPASVAGVAAAQGVSAQGTDHQGKDLRSKAVYFEKDGKIYQAAIYGARIDEAVSATFFEGLVLP